LTVDEAEVFAQCGFQDIFVAAAVVSPARLQRLGVLSARIVQLRVQVDRVSAAEQLAVAVQEHGGRVQVLIEVNVGHNRTGVDDVAAALEIARALHRIEAESEGAVSLVGVTGYEGHTPVLAPAEKTAATRLAHARLSETRGAIASEFGEQAAAVVSGGGSSNYVNCLREGVLTELQAGGGALTDQLYAEKAGLSAHGHQMATFLLTEVTSVSADGRRAMADAGFKAVGWHPFAGFPRVLERDDVEVYGMSAEHLKLRSTDPTQPLRLRPGDRLKLAAPYLDSLAHLHSRILATRDQLVVDEFAIVSIRK
jgi:D-serine deaminase-like pyridoxal phosphate-dependent protein